MSLFTRIQLTSAKELALSIRHGLDHELAVAGIEKELPTLGVRDELNEIGVTTNRQEKVKLVYTKQPP